MAREVADDVVRFLHEARHRLDRSPSHPLGLRCDPGPLGVHSRRERDWAAAVPFSASRLLGVRRFLDRGWRNPTSGYVLGDRAWRRLPRHPVHIAGTTARMRLEDRSPVDAELGEVNQPCDATGSTDSLRRALTSGRPWSGRLDLAEAVSLRGCGLSSSWEALGSMYWVAPVDGRKPAAGLTSQIDCLSWGHHGGSRPSSLPWSVAARSITFRQDTSPGTGGSYRLWPGWRSPTSCGRGIALAATDTPSGMGVARRLRVPYLAASLAASPRAEDAESCARNEPGQLTNFA